MVLHRAWEEKGLWGRALPQSDGLADGGVKLTLSTPGMAFWGAPPSLGDPLPDPTRTLGPGFEGPRIQDAVCVSVSSESMSNCSPLFPPPAASQKGQPCSPLTTWLETRWPAGSPPQ